MLTASDAATAIGCNPYEPPDSLVLKKCGHIKFNGNVATEHGNKYEDEARDIYCERYGEVSHEIGLYPHPDYDWLGGSPDGITESGKLLEIKCPLARKITDEVPVHYLPQLQLLMEILELEECDFIQYKPLSLTWPNEPEFMVTHVQRDRGWFSKYMPIMKKQWDRVNWYRDNDMECKDLIKPKKEVKHRKIIRVPCSIADLVEDSQLDEPDTCERPSCIIEDISDDEIA